MLDKLSQIPSDLWVGVIISIVGSFCTFIFTIFTKIRPKNKIILEKQLETVYAPLYTILKCDYFENSPKSLLECLIKRNKKSPPFNFTYIELQESCKKIENILNKYIIFFPDNLKSYARQFIQNTKWLSQKDISRQTNLFKIQYDIYLNLCNTVISNFIYTKNKLGYPKSSNWFIHSFKYYDFNTKKEIIELAILSIIAIAMLFTPLVIVIIHVFISPDSIIWLYRLIILLFLLFFTFLVEVARRVIRTKSGSNKHPINFNKLLFEFRNSIKKQSIIDIIKDINSGRYWYK